MCVKYKYFNHLPLGMVFCLVLTSLKVYDDCNHKIFTVKSILFLVKYCLVVIVSVCTYNVYLYQANLNYDECVFVSFFKWSLLLNS